MEELKDFKPWEFAKSKYLISNDGRVYSLITNKFLTAGTVKGGYRNYTLISDEGKRVNKYAHVLVAEIYVQNPDNLEYVNHIDENTSNNHFSNLEWCSFQYNVEYSQSENYTFTSPSGERVDVFNLQKFCRDNSLSAGNMHSVYNGKRKKHKGWTK